MSVVAIEPRQTERPPGLRLSPPDARATGARGGLAGPECSCPDFCELDHAND